ncbi:hypothetical protein F7Q99_15475 [Streptomyces kaniharaensis]|uniref:Uncharacterized protein n=1 Tax=Streptomyces kaniharaensis TaxID=212423 RepID=A0A6N7KVM1_9ACTN|nr:hypothetical protein [Streptomyces kaniharaensis]MQS13633.1 hypothetical protein [Streptomyces kaniharaensis]
MQPATVPPPRIPRLGRGWYLAAVLSAVLAVGMCLLGWRQADQADRIAAHPVRVEGVVTQLPTGGGTYSAVSYRAGGQQHTAAALPLADGTKVGDAVCLEHAADDAGAVRICGDTYPQPVGIGLARFSVPVAVVLFLVCVLRIRRHRRAIAVRGMQGRLATTVALATGALAEGMPAITHGKRSRRKRRAGGRRAQH